MNLNLPKSKNGLTIKVDSIQPALHKVVFEFKDFIWYSETPEAIVKILGDLDKHAQYPTKQFRIYYDNLKTIGKV